MKNNLNKKQLQERVLMMMKYDMNKTHNENKITLKEETGDTSDTADIAEKIYDEIKGDVNSENLANILNLLKQRVIGKKFRDGSTCLLSKALEYYTTLFNTNKGKIFHWNLTKMNGNLVHDIQTSSNGEPQFKDTQSDLINAINTELNSANCKGSSQLATQNQNTAASNTSTNNTTVKPPLPNLPDISKVQKEEHGFPACIKGQNPTWHKGSDGTWSASFHPEGITHNYPQDFPKNPTFTAWANGRVMDNETGEMGTLRCDDSLPANVIQQNTDLATNGVVATESKKMLSFLNLLFEQGDGSLDSTLKIASNTEPKANNSGVTIFWDKNYNIPGSTSQPNTPTTNPTGQKSSTTTNPSGSQNNFYQIPGPLGNTNGVKTFQDWLDANHPGWHKKYGVLDKNVPKGYGTYGPQTTLGWSQFGQQYLASNGKTQPQIQSQNTNTNSTVQAPTNQTSNVQVPSSPVVGPSQTDQLAAQNIANDNTNPNNAPNNDNTDPNLTNVQGTDQGNNGNTDQGTQVPQQQQVYSQQSQGYVAPNYYNQIVSQGHIQGNPGDRHLTYNGPQLNQRQLNAINNHMKTTGYGFVRNPGNSNNGQRFTWQKGAPFYTRGGGNNGGGRTGGGFRGRR